MRNYILPISFIFILLFTTDLSNASDWPCWRGEQSDGISREKDWNVSALKNGIKILWKADVGQGHSSVAIREGSLYTQGSCSATKDGKKSYEEMVYCLSASTGEIVWSHSYPTRSRPFTGPRATPAVDGDRLFTLGAQGDLFCFDAGDGKILWSKNLVTEKLSRISRWGFCSSPVVVNEILLLNAGSSGVALKKSTGAVVWKSDNRSCSVASPVLTKIENETVALINADRYLYAIELNTGKPRWKYPWPYCDADPVLIRGRIFLFGGKPGNERCRSLIKVSDGKPEAVWPIEKMNVAFQSCITWKGYIYAITCDKKNHHFECIDLISGDVMWRKKINEWGAFSIADGKIIFIEGDGDLVLIECSPKSLKEISRANVFDIKYVTAYPENQPNICWTAPVLCEGKIYLRNSHGEIVCIDANAK